MMRSRGRREGHLGTGTIGLWIALGVILVSPGGCRAAPGATGRHGGADHGALTAELAGKYVKTLPGVVEYLEKEGRRESGAPEGMKTLEEAIDEEIVRGSGGLERRARSGGYATLTDYAKTHRLLWEAYNYLAIRKTGEELRRRIEAGEVREVDESGRRVPVERIEGAYRSGEEFDAKVPQEVRENASTLRAFLSEIETWREAFEGTRTGEGSHWRER